MSRSDDPFLNLSIENYLLKNTPEDSTVLFLYVNRPCIVIGRNQNPWLEANLERLKSRKALSIRSGKGVLESADVLLVRRRSGGGTVFHDHGNLNYSVICPTHDFKRDTHVEMVVRAIRQLNPRARVNERHDIVLDQGAKLPPNKQPHPDDTHTSAFFTDSPALKVSGSAFKLTRKRSLHHGTCLVQSPNLKSIHPFLDAPVRHYMKARGVDSVRSPISNIQEGLDEDIQTNVSAVQYETIKAFVQMYGLGQDALKPFERPNELRTEFQHGESWVSGHIEGSVQHLLEIRAGVLELKVFALRTC